MQDNRDNHPLDLSYLKEMVGHDPEFMIEVLETFIEQTPFYMAELDDALLAKDLKKVANCAHKIKPTFCYVGRNDVKEFVQSLENDAKNDVNIDLLTEKVNELHLLLDKVYVQIQDAITAVRLQYNIG
ncbi:Hpt domain-containing protein [Pedobacter jejuensis]|uniref:Hpt domain-containing protein n=1 Tax=Pedobacter jejuensis TaxID=1268550 RepID=A0A3N0C2F7_9SPHI|nr:Hpt domain-containing protein [Pedobacter jejuensis]RNL56612.1 Hpt domain-containing protein [Pedobacter jejuensis]